MDGVLVDSEPLHHRALNRALARHGRTLSFADFATYIGTTTHHTWADLVVRLDLPGPPEAHIAAYDAALLADLRAGRLEPSPGLRDLLEALDRRDLPVAVASSSPRPWVTATLAALGLAGRFPVIVSGEEVPRGKPDPAIYLLAAARLRLPPERCLAVEDAPHGVAAARAAGLPVLALRTPYIDPAALAAADRLVDSLRDFPLEWLA
jgi:HAD superfamily hydrolase (TIGR01509 family)